MSDIRSVKLEFLRPGPAHNQLLSPLTPYVAVCGDDGSVTVHLPFEHRELLVRLKRLRYESGLDPAQDVQRQAEVRSMGEAVGEVIGKVPSLLSAISGMGSDLVHLRLPPLRPLAPRLPPRPPSLRFPTRSSWPPTPSSSSTRPSCCPPARPSSTTWPPRPRT